MKLDKGYVCMNRCDGTKTVQLYDRETNGRVFTCADCKFEVCTDCDRPEYTGESCFEYRQRLAAIHSEAENKTHSAFKSCPECASACFHEIGSVKRKDLLRPGLR
jgi:hypothetical protein